MTFRMLISAFLIVCASVDVSYTRHIGQEIVQVTQHSAKPRSKRSTHYADNNNVYLTGTDFPTSMQFTLHLNSGDKVLNLEKQRTPQDVTVRTEDGVINFDEAKSQYAVYQDVNTHSVMIVDCSHSVEFCTLDGSFYHLGNKFNMKPVNNSLTNYNVTKASPTFKPGTTSTVQSHMSQKEQLIQELLTLLRSKGGHSIKKRSANIATTCNHVEIEVCADPSVWNYFYELACHNELAAEVELARHYLALFSEVDLRYKCLSEEGICLRIVLTVITISKTDDSIFAVDADNDGFKEAETAIDRCRVKLIDPHVDFIICLTRLDMEYEDDPDFDAVTYFGVICTEQWPQYRAGVSEDVGDDTNLILASMLLGALNVYPDGENDNNCNSSNLFISAEFHPAPHVPIITNPWQFSECAIDKLQAFLNSLDAQQSGNCLKMGEISDDDFEAYSLKDPFPGQIFDLDYQCQLTYGLDSYAVVGPNETSIFDVEDICYKGVWCLYNGGSYRSRIYNGSPCGCKKICVKNVCVRKFNIPLGEGCDGCCECEDDNAICDCETKTCVCDEGFYDSNLEMANGTCELYVGNNETCPFDEACEDPFAECDNDTNLCECIEGYVLRDGDCVRFCDNNTLPDVANGMWIPQDNVEGSIANLQCNGGYKATSIDTCSICGADGNFSEVSAQCQRDCGCPPQTDNNGVFNLTVEGDTCLGDTAKLYCCPGYGTQYEVIITCEDTVQGWSNASEECDINECSASSLPYVSYGEYVIQGDSTVGDIATLVCDEGYVANSTDTCAVCEPDGYFSSVTAICIRDCKCPPPTPDGDFVLTDPHNTTENSEATLVCATGFGTSYPITITCENTELGWPTPPETCSPIECDAADLPNVTYGMYVQKGNQSGNIATLECNENYVATSSDTCVVCLPNGTYSSASAECVYDCGCPPETPNGFFSLDDHDNTTDGATATLICNTGFNTSYPQTITCDVYEPRWTDTPENCTIIECPDNLLPAVNNGSYNSLGNEVGNIARLECDYGFEPTNPETCSVCGPDGSWSPVAAECIRNCGCPPEIPEGDFVLDNPPNTTENVTATLVCATGYGTTNTVIITCENTEGGWSDASENCTMNTCPNSTLPDANNGEYIPEGNEVNDLAKLVCDDGYVPTSDHTCSVCQPNEMFSVATAVCLRDCGCPPSTDKGEFTLTSPDNTTDGATAVLVCDTGYETSMTQTITCQNTTDGWTDANENCTLIECPVDTLPDVDNGGYEPQGNNTFRTIATLVCEEGYCATSADTCSICLSNGTYSAATAECVRDCKCPPQTPNGQFVLINASNTKEGAEATLECDEGYMTSYYPIKITCENNPQGWSDASENCTIKTCPANTLPSVNNGSYVPEAAPDPIVGTVATLVCEEGYVPDSEDTCALCLPTGSYSQPTATCKRDCKCPPLTANGAFNLDTEGVTTENAAATLTCAEGYEASVTIITCQNTEPGWSMPGDTCAIKDCEGTPDVTDGAFNPVAGTTVGALAILTCDPGFSPSNDHICIACEISGSWTTPTVQCIEDCGELPDAENGEFTLDVPGSSQLGDTATLTCCPDSYVNSPPVKITCQSGGWTDPAENCTLRDCMTPPDITNGMYIVTGGITTVGGTATLTCNDGYKADGLEVCIDCMDDGNWSTLPTACIRDCGCPPVPPNGAYSLTVEGDTCENATATLTCADGYSTTSSPITITCLDTDDGWSDATENCTLIGCVDDDLPSVNFGNFTSQGNTVGSKALLTCQSGYSPDSDDICIACELGGTWSSTSTSCVVDCGIPTFDSSQSFTLNGGTQLGDTAEIVCCCDLLTCETTVTCTAEGWSDLDRARCKGCPNDNWVRNNNTCYLLSDNRRTNLQAVAFCNSFDDDCLYDGHLVIYETEEEREFVRGLEQNFLPAPQIGFWLALYQNGTNGDEFWFPGGISPTYTDWGTNQPNGADERCTCDRMDDNFRWYDRECLNAFVNDSANDRRCNPLCELKLSVQP